MNGEMKVGLFVLAGAILIGTALFLLGDYSFQTYYPVYAEFTDVAGLPDKATVRLSGVEVGKIKNITLRDEKVVVQLAIREGVKIYRGARFSVGSTSVIGSKFLQVDQGKPALGVVQSGETVMGEDIVPLDKAVARAVDSLELLVNDIRGEGKIGKDLQAILGNLRETTANINDIISNGGPHTEKALENLDSVTARMDALLAKADAVIGKIDRGEGVAGSLVSDPKMKENVSEAITNMRDASASVKDVLGRVNGFRTFIKWDYNYEPLAKAGRSDFGLKIYPRPGRYYYIGGSNLAGRRDVEEGVSYETKNTIDAQFGWEIGDFDLYAGVLHGTGGAGLAWKPFFNSKWDRLSVLVEASDFGRNRRIKDRSFNDPRLDAGVNVKVNKYLSAGMRVNDLAEVKRVNYTTRVLFEDKDIAYLFGLISFSSAGMKGRSSSN